MLQDASPTPARPPSSFPGRRAAGRAPLPLAVAAAVLAGALAGGAPRAAAGDTVTSAPDANADVRRYCTNIAVAAGDARFAWQTAKLADLEGRIKARVLDLQARTEELRAWLAKREAVERQANERLVGIYAKMRPETAATQIAGLDDDMAAAVLGQLNPGKASAIFNELVPERATKLAALIAATPTANANAGAAMPAPGTPPAGGKAP